MFFVFTSSVRVKHFWVDLDGMACFGNISCHSSLVYKQKHLPLFPLHLMWYPDHTATFRARDIQAGGDASIRDGSTLSVQR